MLLEKLTCGDKPVRIQMTDQGEPWFCLSDVGVVLDLKNPRDFLNSEHCLKEGVETFYTPTPSGEQEMVFINEPNLYALVFRSSKPEAKAFRSWVFEEVLPQIRKTGSYQSKAPAPLVDVSDQFLATLELVKMTYIQGRDHEQRLSALEEERKQSRDNVLALPAAPVALEELPMTKNCRLAVDDLVSLTGNSHHEIWKEAYRQYDLRKDFNLTARVKNYNSGRKPKDQITKLSYVEKHGDINTLYSILLKMAQKANIRSA